MKIELEEFHIELLLPHLKRREELVHGCDASPETTADELMELNAVIASTMRAVFIARGVNLDE